MCFKRKTQQDTPEETQEVKTVKILDPRGMIRTDIEYIRQYLPKVGWQKDSTLEEIAYNQGQHDLLHFIETKVVGRRMNSGPQTPKAQRAATERSRKSIPTGKKQAAPTTN